MTSTAPPVSSPVMSGGPPPPRPSHHPSQPIHSISAHHSQSHSTQPPARSSSAPTAPAYLAPASSPAVTGGTSLTSGTGSGGSAPIEYVSESAYEFLLAEILQWVERDEKRIAEEARRVHLSAQKANNGGKGDDDAKVEGCGGGGDALVVSPDEKPSNQSSGQSQSDTAAPSTPGAPEATNATTSEGEAAAAVMAAERSAARIERMGYDVGYRLCERLAQHRPLLGPGSPSPETSPGGPTLPTDADKQTDGTDKSGGMSSSTTNSPIIMGGGHPNTTMDPKTQLEAVKFLCKEFWTEVFRKQIDKLQTNHRGVFVLKDQELKWLKRLPPDEESARVGAIRILAFPCGLIRGALACLGLGGAVVSCDFLADGRTMASCSFNIKVK